MSSIQEDQAHAFRFAHANKSDVPAIAPKPIILPFSDDSTLIFARRMREVLQAHPDAPPVQTAWLSYENAMSYRQLAQLLPEGPDRVLSAKQLEQMVGSEDVLAIVVSRVFGALGNGLRDPLTQHKSGRACVVAFLGGLDFFPETGFERRRYCDGVFLFPRSEISRFEALQKAYDAGWQKIGFGHPSFMMTEKTSVDLAARKDIYFFAQALSPSTKRGRLHMLRIMAAMARAYPDRTVWIKLRHLPHENRGHLHLERFDYPGLISELPNCPENLKLTAESMEQVLGKAALGITCTSTAAIDLVRAGVPCMVHLDFVDSYRDALVEPMRGLFEKSNLITDLDDMLHLRAHAPDPEWLADMFCTTALTQDVLDTIAEFQDRPFQIR